MPFLFLSLVLAGALSSEQAPQAGTQRGVISAPTVATAPVARVSGRVVEDGTNVPVSGASVTAIASSRPAGAPSSSAPAPALQAIADDDGRYVFDGVPPGRYRIAARKAGFASPFAPDLGAFRTFEVAPGQMMSGVDISLHKAAGITGKILDPFSGEPLARSTVMAMWRTFVAPAGPPRLRPAGQSQTDDLGEFHISGLPPGEYLVVASRPPNYVFATSSSGPTGTSMTTAAPPMLALMTFYPGTADSTAAQPVTVGAGQVATEIVIRILLAATHQVSGTVVDDRGGPVAGARVVIRFDQRTSALGGGPAGEGLSNARGEFTIGGVTSGPYTATATIPKTDAPRASSSGLILAERLSTINQVEITVADANVDGVQIIVQPPP